MGRVFSRTIFTIPGFSFIVSIAFFSLVSWVMFRKRNFFYGEHLIGNAYMVGEISLYQLIIFPLYVIFNHTAVVDVLNTVYLFFMAGFGFFTYYDWFYKRKGEPVDIIICIAAVVINIAVAAVSAEPLMILIYQIKTTIFGE